jgi:hypothetical protein
MLAGMLKAAVLSIRHVRDLLRDQGEDAIADELSDISVSLENIIDNL